MSHITYPKHCDMRVNNPRSEDKEAERRAFNLAFTRAKRRLIMLISQRFGQKSAIPSPYLDELEGRLVMETE